MNFLSELFVFLVAALIVVPILKRLGLSSVIGYLVAGVLIGPSGVGFVDNAEQILHFAEIGVVLLLFIIGLELQPRRLFVMRKAVFGLGSFQVMTTTLALTGVLYVMLKDPAAALIIGFALALSSTAFVLQLLGEKKELNQAHGRAAFGTLLFQDIAVIPAIALLAVVGNTDETMDPLTVGAAIACLLATRFILRPILRIVAGTGIHELFIAASLAIVTGAALLMYHAGLSMGLGAFIAGMLVADSEYRHQLETDVMPFKGLLLGLFFIAVGMSANLSLIVESPAVVIGLTVGLVTVKTLVLLPLAKWHGMANPDAWKTAVVLSQGGEFAFVILTVALSAGFIVSRQMELAVLTVTLSMAATPFLVMALERLLAQNENREFDDMQAVEHAPILIAGFGRFGQIIGRVLTSRGRPFTALDVDPGQVDFVRDFGNEVFYGDATRLDLLQTAGVADAGLIVIAIDNPAASIKLAELLKDTYPAIPVLARARNRQHEIALRELGINKVIRDTLLSSLHLSELALASLGYTPTEAKDIITAFKQHDRQTLERQSEVAHDDAAFKQTTLDASEELKQLFNDDLKPTAVDK